MPYVENIQRIRTTLVEQEYFDGAKVGSTSTSPVSTVSLLSSRTTEFQSPGWRERIRKGEGATTAMSAVKRRTRYQPGYVSNSKIFQGHPGGPTINGHIGSVDRVGRLAVLVNQSPSLDRSSMLILADQQALVAFVSDCRSAQSRLKGQVVAGELGEALRMLRNPAKRLREGVSSYVNDSRSLLNGRKLRRASKRERKRALRDTWLEYSFGWSPFINDIRDAKTALEDAVELRTSQFCSGSALVKGLDAEAVNKLTVQFFNTLSCRYEQRDYVIVTSRYYGRVKLKSTSPEGPRLLSQTFGFSWQEFVPTIWELIPYSFLVDYFTNIGSIIEVLTFQESELLWKSRTNRVIQNRAIEGFQRVLPIPVESFSKPLGHTTIPPVYTDEYKTVERLNVTWPLVADFRFKIPGLGLKWLNIAALLKLRKL